MSFLGGSEPQFDPADAFVPEHIPEPGAFLAGHDVLGGRDHVALHRTAADAFEEYGVYDATFGYNLARLNRDPRHTDAGFRYAEEADDPTTLGPSSRRLPPSVRRPNRSRSGRSARSTRSTPTATSWSASASTPRSTGATPSTSASRSWSPERPIRSQSGIAAARPPIRRLRSDRAVRVEHVPANDHSGAARTDGSMTATDTVLDVRDRDDPPFPIISDALDDLGPDESLLLVNSFEPEPLYDVLADRGFDHETERVDDDEWHVTIEPE